MRKKTVMVADDSASMRALLSSVIQNLGDYNIVEASSGFEALRLLPREQIDLVLTDINMPDINGLELISYLRSNPNYKDIPVFIISTESSSLDIERGKKLGANEYIVKPFLPEFLQKLLICYL